MCKILIIVFILIIATIFVLMERIINQVLAIANKNKIKRKCCTCAFKVEEFCTFHIEDCKSDDEACNNYLERSLYYEL